MIRTPSPWLRRLRPLGRLIGAYVELLCAVAGAVARPLQRVLDRIGHAASGWSGVRRGLVAGPLAAVGLSAVAFSLFAGFGGVSTAANAPVSTSQADITAGQQLYDIHCSSCHGAAGVGGSRGPELITAGAADADFYLSTGRMPLNNPNQEALRHHRFFSDGQIRQLVAYVNALPEINGVKPSGPTIPSIIPLCAGQADTQQATDLTKQQQGKGTCVTLSFGASTYALNCAQCHQIAARGGLLSKGNVIPSLQNATLLQAVEAMRVGPKPMPVFGTGQLNELQASAVAHYVEFLRTPDARGGLTISGFGPVAEGFVGIIVGLGLLLVLSRLIGARK